jgi:hypothetical protein
MMPRPRTEAAQAGCLGETPDILGELRVCLN